MTDTTEQQAVPVAQEAVTVAQEAVVLEDEFYGLSERADMLSGDDDGDTYAIGVRDGYEQAVATIDMLTGGNGEYTFCTVPDDRHCPDPPTMIRRIMARLASVSSARAEGIEACIALCDRMENDESLPDQAVYAAWNLKVGMLHLLKRASASPEPVPATNKAGEVLQADREFAARWIVIAPQNAKMIRAGDWDHHDGVQAAMRHRLATQPATMQEEAR